MFEFTNKFKKMKYLKILIIMIFITNISCEYEKNNQIAEGEISKRVDEILNMMTLEEKVGQMTQIDQRFLDTITDLSTYHIGSLLSGGGSHPEINEPQAWLDMYNKYQNEALKSRLQIPLVYGIDAVHGHNNVYGATIFPHNIGLGATNNPDIVFKVSEITSKEVAATGIDWTFSPCLSSPEDYRWGRTYEGFSSDPALVANLGSAAVSGYQSVENMNGKKVIACAKHFVGDGNTEFGTGMNGLVDRGNTILTIEELKEKVTSFSNSTKRIPKLTDYMVLLAIAFGTVGLSHLGAEYISEFLTSNFEAVADKSSGLSSFASKFFWMISIATFIGIGLSFTKAKKFEGVGASKIGSIFIYILVATIGMKMDLGSILDEPKLILIGLIWMSIHALLLILVAKLIRAPYFFLAVGSQANVGGAASAPVVAAAFHPSLATVGVLLAVFGYVVGTYGAMICTWLMEYTSNL